MLGLLEMPTTKIFTFFFPPHKTLLQNHWPRPAKSDADQGFGVGINPNPNNSGVNIFNEAILFHEALHGRTGKWDAQIQLILGLPSPASSENISIYIKNIVLGYCPSFK